MMLNGRAPSAVWASLACLASPYDVPHAVLGCRALDSNRYGTRELIHDGVPRKAHRWRP